MFGFVVFSCVMVLACVAGLLGPLAGKTAASRHESGSFNVDIAREKLEELERQLEAGEISSDEYEALHQDTHATLIEDAGDMHHSENRQGDSFAISVTLAAAIPVISLLLYLALGSPEGVDYQPTVTQQTADGQDVDTLLGNLEQKLAANPDDATGWALLGRSYMSLQRYAKAHRAFSNLRRIQGDTPDILLQLADAETMMNGGIFTIASRSNVFTALEVEPDNVQANWMAAMSYTQEGNLRAAIPLWEKLEGLLTGQPEQLVRVQSLLEEARAATGIEAQPDNSSAAGSDSIHIKVSLADPAPATVKKDQRVFVYARAVSGPPMPLAVKQLSVADLPAEIILTETDAMIDGMTINRFPELVVGARISVSGQPTAQPGDIQDLSEPFGLPLSEPIELEIGELVE